MAKETLNPPAVKLDIPAVPPSPNRVLGKHWSTKAGIKNQWILWIRSQRIPRSDDFADLKKRVRITLYLHQLYDPDNLVAACKPILDALRHWGLIWNDSARWIDLFVVQEKCKRGKGHTTIELEAMR